MMSRIKLVFLAGVIILFMINSIGCGSNTVKNTDNGPSVSNTAAPQQTIITDKVANSPHNTAAPSAEVGSDQKYKESLNRDNEEVLFSFKVENSPKILSVCLAKTQPDYIVYRFGTKDKIELEFPQNNDSDSWSSFIYSYYLRGGGTENEGMDMNYLVFENGGYEYKVYEEFIHKDKDTQVGIRITVKLTKQKTDIKGLSGTIQGSLIKLRDHEKIKIEN